MAQDYLRPYPLDRLAAWYLRLAAAWEQNMPDSRLGCANLANLLGVGDSSSRTCEVQRDENELCDEVFSARS